MYVFIQQNNVFMIAPAVSYRKIRDNIRAILYLISYLPSFILSVDSEMNPAKSAVFNNTVLHSTPEILENS